MKRIYNVNSQDWYKLSEQATAYLDAFSSEYAKTMVSGEDALLQKNIETICNVLEPSTTFIDLGPGNATKSAFLMDQFEKRRKIQNYIAVDIQPAFLAQAQQRLHCYKTPQIFVTGTFEDFLAVPNKQSPAFIYLGATFGNFESATMSAMLSTFMTTKDQVYLSCAKTPHNITQMKDSYVEVSKKIFNPLAKRLGLDTNRFSIEYNYKTDTIEQGYFTGNKPEDLTFVILGISRKPSAQKFKKDIFSKFNGTFLENDSYIGFIGGRRV